MIYGDLVDEFPREMREPMFRLIDRLVEDLSDSPTRADFHRLESLVEMQGENILALAQAQARTEQRLGSLAQQVGELAQAQKRTEQRLEGLTQRVDELAQAQARTEQRLGSLAEQVGELAQAQIQTEKRLTRLEISVDRLVGEMKKVKQELGGLGHVVGYRLEDEAMRYLPALLETDHGITVEGRLKRDYLTLANGHFIEVNIWGHGIKDGKTIAILGEAKSQLKKRDVDAFLSVVSVIRSEIMEPVTPLLITYQTSPQVKQYALEKNIMIYFSYELVPY
jgi:hypothetical protein